MTGLARLRDPAVRLARSVLGRVPDAILARVLPGSLRWDPRSVDVAVDHSHEAARMLIAPANSAGQALLWARCARERLPGVSAANLMVDTANMRRLAFAADFTVPEGAYVFGGGWRRRQYEALTHDFTHLLLESGRYPYGSVPGRTPAQCVEDLIERGLTVGLLWHGSDIRLPSEHARWEQDSPFGPRGSHPSESTRVLESHARRMRRMISDTGLPVFVSTPGLLDVPGARWLPVVIDPDLWRTTEPPLRRNRPVVAYAPSSSTLKGDPLIDEQLRDLDAEGLISYRRVEGIPSSEMPHLYRSADIVLDQFRLGDYGVAACEALSAGRVVIGHVHDEVRRRVSELTGADVPIVESRYDVLGDTIRRVIADRQASARQAAAGPAFTRAVHDGRRSAGVLGEFLGATATQTQHQQETTS